MPGYGLYQTLIAGLQPIQFTKTMSEKLHGHIKGICERGIEREKEAMFMLICEHARLNDGFSYSSDGRYDLPYLIQTDDKTGDVIFDLYNLPDVLKAILLKYAQLIETQEEESIEDSQK